MKQTIVALACCALIAPLALAQTRSKSKKETTATVEAVTVTGYIITAIEEGAAATSYQPAKTLVIRQDSSYKPGTYVLNGPGHIVDKTGAVVKTAVKPGAHVRVYYTNAGNQRVIDHVVVLD